MSARLNHELDEAAAISMYEYEILVRLFESEAGRVRMSQLADQVSLLALTPNPHGRAA